MNLDERFDKYVYPKVWDTNSKLLFSTCRYSIQVDRITYTYPQPYIVADHSHPIFEFHYCPSGSGSVIIDGKTYEIKPRTFFITGPHVHHSQVSPKHDPTEEYTLMANIEPLKNSRTGENVMLYSDLDDILDIIVGNKAYFGEDKENAYFNIKKIYDKMYSSEKNINLSLYWLLLMQTLLSTAQNITPLQNTLKQSYYGNLDLERIRILDDVFRGYHREISQEIVAEKLKISVRQLNRIVRKHWGTTFKQKYIMSRMELATSLLERLDTLSIDEIAQKLNFSSNQYFSNVFKKYHGISPNEYRKIHKLKKEV